MIRRGRTLAKAPWLALGMIAAAGAARADIETRVQGGEVVYTSRPEQKPGASPAELPAAHEGKVRPPASIAPLVTEVSRRHDLDPGLVATVISVESGFNERAVSPKGARGLMQLMPETARQYGVDDVHDPKANVEAGVAYLKDLARRYNGNMKLALAAYNAGPGAVEKASGVPNYPETMDYLRKIEQRYGRSLGEAEGDAAGGARAPGRVRSTRDAEGNIVLTNDPGREIRIIRKGRSFRPEQP